MYGFPREGKGAQKRGERGAEIGDGGKNRGGRTR